MALRVRAAQSEARKKKRFGLDRPMRPSVSPEQKAEQNTSTIVVTIANHVGNGSCVIPAARQGQATVRPEWGDLT